MPRIYGTPSAKAAAVIQSRAELVQAIRSNDQKSLTGMDEDRWANIMGSASLFPGVETNRFSGFSSYLSAGTKKVWAAARANDLIANVVISTEMSLAWRDPKKNKAGVEIRPDPELLRLLQNPNPHDTIAEMLYLREAHMTFTGNAFWFKDEMNGRMQPRNVFWLSPAHMRIVPDKDSRVAKYRYRVNGEEIDFDPDEIIHFRRPNANDALWGVGDIEQGESLFDDHINRSLYNARFMANGAMPSSVLVRETFDGSQADWEKMQASFEERYGGARNSGKTAWMSGKWSLLQLGLDAAKMQDLEKSKTTIEHIFLNSGVPLSVAGFGSANYYTSRTEDIGFRKYTVLPRLNFFADKMNSQAGFITAFNPELKLDFALAGLVDVEQAMKDYGPLFDRGGITINEMRTIAGLPRKNDPLLDQHYITQAYMPIEIAGIASPSDAELEAATTATKPKPKPADADPNIADDAGRPAKPAKE
jgi:HK97 family phage portal protein